MDFDTMMFYSKQFALVWFFVIFVGILLWVYWPGNKKKLDELGRRGLDDDETGGAS